MHNEATNESSANSLHWSLKRRRKFHCSNLRAISARNVHQSENLSPKLHCCKRVPTKVFFLPNLVERSFAELTCGDPGELHSFSSRIVSAVGSGARPSLPQLHGLVAARALPVFIVEELVTRYLRRKSRRLCAHRFLLFLRPDNRWLAFFLFIIPQ